MFNINNTNIVYEYNSWEIIDWISFYTVIFFLCVYSSLFGRHAYNKIYLFLTLLSILDEYYIEIYYPLLIIFIKQILVLIYIYIIHDIHTFIELYSVNYNNK